MRKTLLMILLESPVLLAAQAQKLTIDYLLGAGVGGGGFARGGGETTTPDGKYTVTLDKGQIALRPADGGTEKLLTSSPEPKSELALAPDGLHVAYISKGQVWSVALNGGDPVQLTHDPAGPGDPRGATDHHPQWNPKGKWILYESGQKGFNELYVVSEDGKVLNLLAVTEIYHGADAIEL